MRLTTTGLKIQIVNRLCIVEVLTTLWYFKNWGASLPFMSGCSNQLVREHLSTRMESF